MRSILIVALATTALGTAAAGAEGARVAPISGSVHLALARPPSIRTCADGGFVATAQFQGRMRSNDRRLSGTLVMTLRETASKADEAVITATGTLRALSGRQSPILVFGADHGNQFDGVLVAHPAAGTEAILNWTSHQRADGSADGTFGTPTSSGARNTAVVGQTSC